MARIFQRGGQWWLDYRHAGRRYREPAGPAKRDALRLLEKRKVEIRENKFFDVRRRCSLTFAEFCERHFFPWADASRRSAERYRRAVKNMLAHFGSMNLERITVNDVEAFRRARLSGAVMFRGRKAGPACVNRELATLRRVLNLAVELGVLHGNHLAGKIRLMREPEGRLKYLTPEQAERLLACCNNELCAIVHLAMLTGMRYGEIVGLRWQEVDLRQGVIRLPGERTKNARPRTVPLSADAKAILIRAWKERLADCPLVFHREGRPIASIRSAFEGACARAGLEDFRFHDLRHSFASALAMKGVPLQTIGELLGHRTLSMTQRYSHLSPDALTQAVEKAAGYLADKNPEAEGEVLDFPAEAGK